MNRPLFHVCAALSLAALPVYADGTVKLVATTEAAPPIAAFFGGREQNLNLQIAGVAVPVALLRADLFLAAGSLAVPVARDVHVNERVTLPDMSPHAVQGSLKFPEVKRETAMIARLALIDSANPSTPIPLGDLRFEIFPATLTKELVDSFPHDEDDSPRVVVFGSGQKLRPALKALKARFEDAGAELPGRFDPAKIYLGEPATQDDFQAALDRSAGASVALFHADETVPPGIYASRVSDGVLVDVTLPLLDHLADDPRAQTAFLKIIRLLTPAH
jgi:hypothetical protein